MGRNTNYYGIRFDRRSQNFGFHMIAQSQLIANDRRRSQKIEHGSIFCDRLRSSAIVCDHDRKIADDRRSVFPYDRRRSQNFLRSAIRDPRSFAIIWKPACSYLCFYVLLFKKCQMFVYSGHALSYTKLLHRHATEGNKYFK